MEVRKRRQTTTLQRRFTLTEPLQAVNSNSNSIRVILAPRTPKQDIIVLCTDLTNKSRCRHIFDVARALHIYHYNVTVVTCQNRKKPYKSLKDVKVIQIGAWIPKSFFGYLQDFCYLLRSAYAAFWITKYAQRKPTMVFCEANQIVLPILNRKDIKVAYFQYLYGIIQEKKNTIVVNKQPNWLTRYCLPFANAVLLPSKQYLKILKTTFVGLHFNPVIVYPYVHTKKLFKTDGKDLYKASIVPGACYSCSATIFLVLGEYRQRSNFELAVKAFEYLFTIVCPADKRRIYLIISGHNSIFLKSNKEYYRKIKRMVKISRCPKNYVLVKSITRDEKKSLIDLSSVIVHTPCDEIYNKNILDAMSRGKPIVAANSGYMKEIIQNRVTGYLVEPDCCRFASAMYNFVSKPKIIKSMGQLAQTQFTNRYSLMAFGARLKKLIRSTCVNGAVISTYPRRKPKKKQRNVDDKKIKSK